MLEEERYIFAMIEAKISSSIDLGKDIEENISKYTNLTVEEIDKL